MTVNAAFRSLNPGRCGLLKHLCPTSPLQSNLGMATAVIFLRDILPLPSSDQNSLPWHSRSPHPPLRHRNFPPSPSFSHVTPPCTGVSFRSDPSGRRALSRSSLPSPLPLPSLPVACLNTTHSSLTIPVTPPTSSSHL